MISDILQDWEANAGNAKGRFVLVLFRTCQIIRRWPDPFWLFGCPVLLLYVLLVHWLMGIELDYKSSIGPGLALHHGTGVVVHEAAVIGANCILRHGVTLGERRRGGGCPVLGDHVETGVHAIILGPVRIGDGAVVGAGSVVLEDVAPGTVVAGNPAKVIRPALS
jgi:putative colanic acid biosynthesis acetyltransferase WcaB